MSKFSALAIDLDGTLLVGEDLSEANRVAVRRASDAGLAVVIATARWREMALRVADQIGIEGPVIACSGAQVFDPVKSKDVFDERLPEDFVGELFDLCDQNRCIATVTFSDRVLLKLDGEPDRSLLADEMEWVPALTGAESSLPRVAAIQGSRVVELIKTELAPRFADTVMVADSIGPNGKLILMLTSARADKGKALVAACEHLDIAPSSVIAFGDAENDVPMFSVAGASVAMGQADETTKSFASRTTLSNTEDGVAVAINELLDSGEL